MNISGLQHAVRHLMAAPTKVAMRKAWSDLGIEYSQDAFMKDVAKAIAEGKPEHNDRSKKQNRLMWKWAGEVAQQRGEEAYQIHAEDKLDRGIPIRCEEDTFREDYEAMIAPLPREMQLKLMSPPMDFPVTRAMNVGQMTRFLNAVYLHWKAQGYELTIPDDDVQWTEPVT